ncbi:MAG: PfkB family carbohydrate kinase [Acidobacteriota bacterium]|nr:PfkB family carbohydrate kinase [Acidobacteriota bacterium]
MKITDLNGLLESIRRIKAAVVGDYCLDAYWFIDEAGSEKSVETGLPTQPVQTQRYSLGGAGNVANNLKALGAGDVRAYGITGDDPFGRTMRGLMEEAGIDTRNLLVQKDAWQTHVYIKPNRENREENRIDFGNFNRLQRETADALIARLDRGIEDADIIIINQQARAGIHTDYFRRALNGLIRKHAGKIFIADTRKHSGTFRGAYSQLNDYEAAALCGRDRLRGDIILQEEAKHAGNELFKRWRKPVFITRGERGCLVADRKGIHEIPGLLIISRIDAVGAGDSMLAGIAAGLAAGRGNVEAAILGNFTAGVTIQKVFQTGTASPAEILKIGSDPDYVYSPELAGDIRKARRFGDSEIEIVHDPAEELKITHAIFDHDGTISILREGWEQIMSPMMVKAVLGKAYHEADESVYGRVLKRVNDYIDKTTGIQTLIQMHGLVEIVKEFGIVPADAILDARGYKSIYNRALLDMVRGRLQKLKRGELSVEDFTLKNAVPLLRRLHGAGIRLYLASGTDEADVKREARALGYAPLFEGRIYGAVGDVTKEAKKTVLERILRDIGAENAGHMVAFGDGPVEIRETHKKGGYTVGLASHEIRRYGLDLKKRERLIKAGADIVIPDYSQMETLFGYLKIR